MALGGVSPTCPHVVLRSGDRLDCTVEYPDEQPGIWLFEAEATAAGQADFHDPVFLVKRLDDKREREIQAARLARLQAEHSHSTSGAPQPSGSGPLFVCPVDPPRGYSDDFGAPRWGGGYHTHQGIDIFAPRRTPIRAPFPGSAVSASNTLGGLSVKVYGSQGFVYNAHMSAIGRLGSVSTGTVIGYVGDSGDAQGTSPHDHFEWHPGNGSAVDPFNYLNAVC